LGIKTDLIKPGDDLADKLEMAMNDAGLALQDGDILVVSESTLATAEGRLVYLEKVEPSPLARLMAERYEKDPREMQLILEESDQIVGGIPGVVLTLREGFLYPNAGIDNSNAPPGSVVLFPSHPLASARQIRERLGKGRNIAVIIGDSRTHPLRLGCVGVALACAGLDAVEDARGQRDLFGRELRSPARRWRTIWSRRPRSLWERVTRAYRRRSSGMRRSGCPNRQSRYPASLLRIACTWGL